MPHNVLKDPAEFVRLARTALDQPTARTAFESLTRRLANLLKAPIVVISIVDGDQQVFVSQIGLPEPLASEGRIHVEQSYCREIIGTGKPLVVEDTSRHPALCTAAATAAMGLRAYAGVPLLREDTVVGSLCAMDVHPREWSISDTNLLSAVACSVISDIESRASYEAAREKLAREKEEQEAINAALRASEERLQFVAKATNDVIWDWNLLTNVSTWNDAAKTLFGSSEAESAHTSEWWAQQIHPEDRDRVVRGIHTVLEGMGSGWRDEYRIRRADGTYATIFDRGYVSRDAAGKPIRMIGAMTDMSENAQAVESIRFQGVLLNSVQQAVIAIDSTGRIVYWNRFASSIYGWEREEVMGRHPWEVVSPPEARAQGEALFQKVSQGVSWSGELTRRDKSGRQFPAMVTLSPLSDNAGTFTGVVAVSVDVTDRKQLEEQFRQSQKMEAVGRLASGIAHDFNNILTVIRANVDFLLDELGPMNSLADDAREIRTAAERAAGLTRQLLAFSRKQILQPKPLALGEVVKGVAPMLRRLIGEHVELLVEADSSGLVLADRGQIEQIIVNLAVNAGDAMPDGGQLSLVLSSAELSENVVRGTPVMAGKYLMLEVNDTGSGMDEATVAKAFEPFFTTKDPGKGTGLGLSTVYGIVKQSGGYVWILSAVGKGTNVSVYLPEISSGAAAANTLMIEHGTAGGSETILLVEDDEAVRRLAHRILEKAGYTALVAASGAEAMRIASQHAGPIDLLVTDMVMPGMNGRALLERVAAVRPRIKSIFMSGYTDDDVIRRGLLRPGTLFIQKPFSVETLARSVRATLDGTTPELPATAA
ncbi:MAG TPA: PAS domain S-box protein [Gemmatimonadaceae bacterium]|nr:PAS domain S-box protein [Gemmatimonadaceae bacterium]